MPEDLISYLEGLNNPPDGMAKFKRDIANYIYLKYKDEADLKEANIQANLFEKYSAERKAEREAERKAKENEK